MITDPWFYAAAVVAVLITGTSKGGLGGGLGVMAVPILALVIPPVQAAAVMLPILCFMDILSVWHYRGRWDGRHLRVLLPAAVVGIALAAFTFRYIDERFIKLMVALIAILFTLDFWFRPRLSGGRGPDAVSGGFWGALAGFTSFVAHAGGPPVNVYLLSRRLDKTVYVGTSVVFFIVVNYVKLIPYAWLGQFHAGNLLTSLVLLPLGALGIALGVWLHSRIPVRMFYQVCYALLFVTGLKLAWDVAAG